MRFYHRTSQENAGLILAYGFRYGVDMTESRDRDVRLSLEILSEKDGVEGDFVITVDAPIVELIEFECKEDGRPYREFRVSADILDGISTVIEVRPMP